MKKIALAFSILAVSGLVMLSCKKEKNTEITPDMEFQSSVDISYAMQIVSDIDMISSYLGEDDLDLSRFFRHIPASVSPSIVTISRDTANKEINVSFNNALCRDGHVRAGSIILNYDNGQKNGRYYRDYGFSGKVFLIGYEVDGWKIKMRNDFAIKNNVAPVNYDPKTTNLSWTFTGDIDMRNPKDTTKNMHCNINFTKTLKNTSDKVIFNPNKAAAINWSLSTVEYKGSMWGETSRIIPFKYEIVSSKPLYRDFQCSPDKVYGTVVGSTSVTPRVQMYTPFTNGAASFTTSTAYPRMIYYGPEDGSMPAPCDNTGAVMIKGISYPIDFKKVY